MIKCSVISKVVIGTTVDLINCNILPSIFPALYLKKLIFPCFLICISLSEKR